MDIRVLALLLLGLTHHVTGHVCEVSGTSANCRGRGLTSVPSDLPSTVTSLDLCDNKIGQLDRGTFARLPQLTNLSLRRNELSGYFDFQGGAVLQPLAALLSLDLGGNQLTELGNSSFSGLRQLQRLLLDHNQLQRLQPCAFCGLTGLRELVLQANLLCPRESYPADIFSPLRSLTTLDLSYNSDEASPYPEAALTPLTQLETLTLDLLSDPLPRVVSTFGRLTALRLRVQKWTHNVTNASLACLAGVPVARLEVTGYNLYDMEAGALEPVARQLQELQVVDLRSLSLPTAIQALHVLQGRNMSFIRLEGVSNSEYYLDRLWRHEISEEKAIILRNLCVKKLNLARNAVMVFETRPMLEGCLRKTLKYFDFSGNYVALTTEQQGFLFTFRKLEYIDLSSGLAERGCRGYKEHKEKHSAGNMAIYMTPNLQYLNVSHCLLNYGSFLYPIYLLNTSHLHTLDVSYCGGQDFVYPIKGLENLTKLYVSGNNLGSVLPTLMDDFGHTKLLAMRDTSFDPVFLMQHGVRFFQNMRSLETIDLSENHLSALPSGIFPAVKEIILSANSFSSIPVELDRMSNLVTLDLTFNTITFLSGQQRELLDAHAQSSKGHFRLLLEGNPLTCDCSVLDFVSWLGSTSVRLDRGGNYSCLTDGGVYTCTAEVAARLEGKWRQCDGGWWLGVASACLLLLLLTLVLVFLLTRFWTNLQHVVLRMLGFGHALLRRADFQYDVYLAYSDQDYRFACVHMLPLLEADGLRVYVRDRDEPLGESRAGEVVRAVGSSWRLVFLLSEAFLRDEWCQFTALTAARCCCAAPRGRRGGGRVLLLLLRPLPRADLPPSLLTVVEEQDVFDLGGGGVPGPALWGRVLHRLMAP